MSLQYTGATLVDRPKRKGTFQKGQGGPGRPPGVPNKLSRAAKAEALRLLEDPDYRAAFADAWKTRKIAPQIEMMVWHYAYGKPKETLQLESKTQPQMVELIRQLPEDAKKRLGEAMADLFRAKLQAGDAEAIDVDAQEVE